MKNFKTTVITIIFSLFLFSCANAENLRYVIKDMDGQPIANASAQLYSLPDSVLLEEVFTPQNGLVEFNRPANPNLIIRMTAKERQVVWWKSGHAEYTGWVTLMEAIPLSNSKIESKLPIEHSIKKEKKGRSVGPEVFVLETWGYVHKEGMSLLDILEESMSIKFDPNAGVVYNKKVQLDVNIEGKPVTITKEALFSMFKRRAAEELKLAEVIHKKGEPGKGILNIEFMQAEDR